MEEKEKNLQEIKMLNDQIKSKSISLNLEKELTDSISK